MKPNDIPDQSISKDDRDFFKLQLAAAFKARKEAETNKIDTPANLKDAENLVKSADSCIGGTFSSSIKGKKVADLEDRINKTKTKTSSKFVETIKKWAEKFVELCKSPNSISRKKGLEQATEVLYKGSKIIQVGSPRLLSKDVEKATKELKSSIGNTAHMQKELKDKLNKAPQQDTPGKSKLQRGKPVTQKPQSRRK